MDELNKILNAVYTFGYEDGNDKNNIHTISQEEVMTILQKHNDMVK